MRGLPIEGLMMLATIFDIQRFCTKDGPGIRTTIFFKGCPLRCLWCHNPESQRPFMEQMQKPKGEGAEPCGKEYTIEEILEIAEKDRLFYENSGGGITLSGGEPLFQPDFALALMERAKERGFSVALETCGMAEEQVMRRSAEFADLYLYDYKESDPARHKEYTGVDNAKILQNLALLNRLQKKMILRCPIIPDFNDREDHFEAIAALAEKFEGIQKVQIEPYHSFGADKYRRLGRPYSLMTVQNPQREQVEQWIGRIQSKTKKPIERA